MSQFQHRGPDPYGAAQPGIIPLRPLMLADFFSALFMMFRRSPGLMIGLSALCAAVSQAIWVLLQRSFVAELLGQATRTLTRGEIISPDLVLKLATHAGGTIVLFQLILIPILAPLTAAIVWATAQSTIGARPRAGLSIRSAAPRILTLIGLQALVLLVFYIAGGLTILMSAVAASILPTYLSALLTLALIGCAVGGFFWFAVQILYAIPASILEPLPIIASLRRSITLQRGLAWRSAGILLLLSLMVTITVGILGSFIGVFAASAIDSRPVIDWLTGTILSTATLPFSACLATLLYLDARIRKEDLAPVLNRAAQSGQ